MKILFIADVSLSNPTSGSEQVLSKQAIGLKQRNLNIFAITRKNGNSELIVYGNENGVKEACYKADARNIFRFSISLFKKPPKLFDRFAANTKFSAAICHQPYTALPLILKGKLEKIPLIYVFHSPNHEEFLLSQSENFGYKGLALAQIRRLIEGFCLKKSQRIMVLSHYMKQKVMSIHGVQDNRIVVNPGGVDLDHFKPLVNRIQIKNELFLPSGKIHLLTVRNLEPRMGLDNLIKAVYLLKTNGISVHLVIGGEGPERKNLENMVNEYGLVNNVTITGFIPSNLLPKYYGAADFFILPTRRLEGFGLITPESMACETPVLGTPVGATKEILSNFIPQLLFRDYTPEAMARGIQMVIKEYFENERRYKKLRFSCREYAERCYSWERHISQLKSLLINLHKNKETD